VPTLTISDDSVSGVKRAREIAKGGQYFTKSESFACGIAKLPSLALGSCSINERAGNGAMRVRDGCLAADRESSPVVCSAVATPGALPDSVYERLLQQRIIVLGQQVDDEIANRIAAQLLLLSAEDPTADISLYINSPGGSVTAGMAIFDTMEFIECDVATYVMGLAASMGQFLLSAGTRGKRYALPHAQVLMQQPSAGVGGRESDIVIQAELFRRHKWEMAELISYHTGQPMDRIMVDFDRDRWFSAPEALEYGFVDHVISRVGQLPNAVRDNGNGSAR
jgi:ATP-dependent Clp protease protease subunit